MTDQPVAMWAIPTCRCGPISPEDVRDLGGYPEIPIACYYCGQVYMYEATSSAQAESVGWAGLEELDRWFLVVFRGATRPSRSG